MTFSGLAGLQGMLGDKVATIRRSLEVKRWRFFAGDVPGAAAPDYPDETWIVGEIPITWSSAATSAWLRASIVPPGEIAGIGLAGTPVVLVIVLPIGARIFVDGRLSYQDDWWSDTRGVPLTLAQHLRPGNAITVAINTDRHDGFGALLAAHVRYPRLEEHLWELELFLEQMSFTHWLAENSHERSLTAAWQAALQCLSAEALLQDDWVEWQQGVERARSALSPFASLAKQYTCYLAGHSHIDINWLWTTAETIRICKRDFGSVDALMERYPDFRFSQSQAAVYQFLETQAPELFSRIKQRVREDRWEVTASTWVEGDLNMASGEAIAHHLLYAQRYVQTHFGRRPLICWQPDTFGHPASMPQILSAAGVKYYYCCRGGQGETLFWWEGPDGSRVLTHVSPYGYNGYIAPRSMVQPVADLASRYGMSSGFYVFGVGDHGGGPTARDIEAARNMDHTPFVPRVRLSTTLDFFSRAEREATRLPVFRGELNPIFQGCYTTHADIKTANRRLENMLTTAESVAALSRLFAGDENRQPRLARAWETLLVHQFHDILCGAGIGATYDEARDALAKAETMVASETEAALARLAATLDTGEGGEPRIVVFNPLGWPRTDVARVPLRDLPKQLPKSLEDSQGRRHPVQVMADELVFVARDVPAYGFQVYQPSEEPPTVPPETPAGDDLTLENDLLRLTLHPGSGAIDSLWDKESNRWVTRPSPGRGAERRVESGRIGSLQLVYEQPHPMSAWNLGDTSRTDYLISGASVRRIAQGPVFSVAEITRSVLNSFVRQRLYLYRGMRRIDVETEIEWNERGGPSVDAPMLRLSCTPALKDARATFEIPFGWIQRPANGDEVPALRWADISDDSYGLSLLNNGKYGHSALYHTLSMTLVRSSYDPDPVPDIGLHRFTYSLYPHAGTWRDSQTTRRAAELNQPLLCTVESAHSGKLQPGRPLLRCTADSVLPSTLKLAEEQPAGSTDLILRLYEAHGQPANTLLYLATPCREAAETTLVEETTSSLDLEDGCRLSLSFRPCQIRSLRLRY